jgi:hypothetical protein
MNGDADELSIIYESTIIGKNPLPVLRVAAAKRTDFALSDNVSDDFIPDMFHVPNAAVVSLEKWVRIAKKLETEGLWDELEHDWIVQPWRPPSPRVWSQWRKEIQRVKTDISHIAEQPSFAKACLRGILAQPVYTPIATRKPRPIVPYAPRADDWVLSTLYSLAYLQRDRIEVAPDELAYWANAAACLTRPVPRNVEESVNKLLECDIPYSLSPRSQSSPLSRFVQEARLVAIFPLASVVVPATHLLSEGSWVAAFEVLLSGAGASVVLASTFSLVEWILHLPRKKK